MKIEIKQDDIAKIGDMWIMKSLNAKHDNEMVNVVNIRKFEDCHNDIKDHFNYIKQEVPHIFSHSEYIISFEDTHSWIYFAAKSIDGEWIDIGDGVTYLFEKL